MVGFVVVVVYQQTHQVVVIRLDLSMLSSVSKHNMQSNYGWVCRCCRRSVNKICGRNKVEFVVVVCQ
jgi:hypothetical protein